MEASTTASDDNDNNDHGSGHPHKFNFLLLYFVLFSLPNQTTSISYLGIS